MTTTMPMNMTSDYFAPINEISPMPREPYSSSWGDFELNTLLRNFHSNCASPTSNRARATNKRESFRIIKDAYNDEEPEDDDIFHLRDFVPRYSKRT